MIIIRESPGEAFFLIGHGSVDVRQRGTEAEERLVATLGAGNFFGERALIVDEPRNATCVAASDQVDVFALDKANFKHALEIGRLQGPDPSDILPAHVDNRTSMYDRSKAEKFSTGWGGSALGIDSKPIWQLEGGAAC